VPGVPRAQRPARYLCDWRIASCFF